MASKKQAPSNGTAKTHILDTAQRIVGAKGFAAVGLNQILGAAGVPKGSFYYYFASKEAFGKDLLDHYFEKDLLQIDSCLSEAGRTARERIIKYWRIFRSNQEGDDANGKCLAVKLGAEVSDMSEEMRLALKAGTSAIVSRLTRVLKEGVADGSIKIAGTPAATAQTLYQLWMGASLVAKISHDRSAFTNASAATERILAGEVL